MGSCQTADLVGNDSRKRTTTAFVLKNADLIGELKKEKTISTYWREQRRINAFNFL